jgi:GAF domain-containing protein
LAVPELSPESTHHKIDAAFAELSGLTIGDEPLDDVLHRTAALAKSVLRVPIEASITLVGPAGATTPAFTAQPAYDLDQTQYSLGYGPCLASAEAGQLVRIPDIATETRWPAFTQAALERNVRSTLSVPLPVQRQVIGALNLYAEDLAVFDSATEVIAERFGAYAAVAIANAHLLLSASELADQMAQAMESRAVIEQAKGVLMGERKCSAGEAFDMLVNLSQTTHRKLRDVAAAVIELVLSEQ